MQKQVLQLLLIAKITIVRITLTASTAKKKKTKKTIVSLVTTLVRRSVVISYSLQGEGCLKRRIHAEGCSQRAQYPLVEEYTVYSLINGYWALWVYLTL